MSSTYGTSYLPTMEGTRTRFVNNLIDLMFLGEILNLSSALRVWKEGFDQRVARKQNGFRFGRYHN